MGLMKNINEKTNPLNLVQKAQDYKTNKYAIKEADGDRVCCVFDVDINYNVDNAIKSRIGQ